MKKNIGSRFACLVMAFMMTALMACGDEADDPNAGTYVAKSAEMMGMEIGVEDVFEDGFTIELKNKGKGTLIYDGDDAGFKWELDGDSFHAKGGGAELDGTLKDGVLVLDNVLDSGMKMTLVCEEIAGKKSADADDDKDKKPKASKKSDKSSKDKKDDAVEEDASEETGSRAEKFVGKADKSGEAKTEESTEPEKAEISPELMARYEGDWHGIMYFWSATGDFEEFDNKKCDVAGRFALDEDGNVTAYLLSAKKELTGDKNFHDLKAELDPFFDTLYISGGLFENGSFELASFGEENGLVHAYFNVKSDNGSEAEIELAMRHPDVPWQDTDYPMYPKEGYDYYKGCSLEQVLDSFGNRTPGLPEKTNITGWE